MDLYFMFQSFQSFSTSPTGGYYLVKPVSETNKGIIIPDRWILIIPTKGRHYSFLPNPNTRISLFLFCQDRQEDIIIPSWQAQARQEDILHGFPPSTRDEGCTPGKQRTLTVIFLFLHECYIYRKIP